MITSTKTLNLFQNIGKPSSCESVITLKHVLYPKLLQIKLECNYKKFLLFVANVGVIVSNILSSANWKYK